MNTTRLCHRRCSFAVAVMHKVTGDILGLEIPMEGLRKSLHCGLLHISHDKPLSLMISVLSQSRKSN